MATTLVNCLTPNCSECASFTEVITGAKGKLDGEWWHCDKCTEIMDKMMEDKDE